MSIKKIAITFFIFSFLLAVIFFFSILFLLGNKDFQKRIIGRLESQFNRQVTAGSFRTALIPPVSLAVENFGVNVAEEKGSFVLKSPEVKIHLKLLPLFFRRIEFGSIQVSDGEGYFDLKKEGESFKLAFSQADLELRDVSPDRPMEFTVKAALLSERENFKARGRMLAEWKDGTPRLVSAEAETKLNEFAAAQALSILAPDFPVALKDGLVSWDGSISWKDNKLSAEGTGSLNKAIYALAATPAKISVPADMSFEVNIDGNPVAQKWRIGNLDLHSPYGDFSLSGTIGSDFEVPPFDLRIRSDNVNLDRLPEFLVPLDAAIPNKLGFSGTIQLSVFVKGKPELLSISGGADLTASLLSYASYFSKPKDSPLKIQYDLSLKDGSVLQGDINAWLNEMSLKGTLNDFNVESGRGEITLLSNKFSLEGWESVFQPIQKYPMKGWAKLLVNAKGSFAQPEDLSYNGSLNLEDVEAVYEEVPIRDLDAVFEFTNQRASTGKLDFVAQSSPIHVEYIRNLPPNSSLSVKFASPEWYPRAVLRPLRASALLWGGEEPAKAVDRTAEVVEKILSEKEPLKNFSFSMSSVGNMISVQELFFNVYGGLVRGAGDAEVGAPDPHYNFGIQMEKIALGPLTTQAAGHPVAEGDLYMLGNFQGDRLSGSEAAAHLKGQGEFKIVGGRLNNMDLLGSLGAAGQLAHMIPFAKGSTEFSDLQTNFYIQRGKVVTDEITLVSQHFKAKANGFFSLDGVLNYRVNIFMGKEGGQKPGEADSGIPLQIYGDFANPKIGLDSSMLGQTVEKFVSEKLSKLRPETSPQAEPDNASSVEEAGVNLMNGLMSKKAKDTRAA